MHKLAVFLEEKLQFHNELLVINIITTTFMIHGVQATAKHRHVYKGGGYCSLHNVIDNK